MVMKKINIDNLRIKLPRSMRGKAQELGRSIGTDVARCVANAAGGRAGNFTIDELSLGRVPSLSSVAEHAASKIDFVLAERGKK